MSELATFTKMAESTYKHASSCRKPFKTDRPDGKKAYLDTVKIDTLSFIMQDDNIDNVEVKSSPVHGKGVFATKNIKEGDLITLYPGDIVAYIPDANGKDKNHLVLPFYSERMEKANSEASNKKENIYDLYSSYKYNVNDHYTIIGCPEFTDNPSYCGHLINDRCDFDKITPEIYSKLSLLKTNSKFVNIARDSHVVIVARRDIVKGEEIFISYGVGYWETHLKRLTV